MKTMDGWMDGWMERTMHDIPGRKEGYEGGFTHTWRHGVMVSVSVSNYAMDGYDGRIG